jgi:hypothetical protein
MLISSFLKYLGIAVGIFLLIFHLAFNYLEPLDDLWLGILLLCFSASMPFYIFETEKKGVIVSKRNYVERDKDLVMFRVFHMVYLAFSISLLCRIYLVY